MPFKLVIWDFDGTIVDSRALMLDIFNRLAAEMRYRPVQDPESVRSLTTRQFLRRHGIPLWRLPKLVRRFHAEAAEEAENLKLYPGLLETLAGLCTAGVRLGILSSNKEETIRRCLRANGAEEHFVFVVGYPRLFGKGKALRHIVRAERLAAAEVLYVGDEVRDIEAARKARVASAAVTWGLNTEAILRSIGPDLVAAEPAILRQLIENGRPAASSVA
jgi:phosphoglycolate phosphatase